MKTILSMYDYSGNWSKPYRDAGYFVIQLDLKRGQDCRLFKFTNQVHGILAAPPCTVFASSGARWKRSDQDMIDGISMVDCVFRFVTLCRPKFWVIENPIGKLARFLGKPKMYFNPCDYGDPYTKRTCLWGSFNEPEKNPVKPTEGSRMHLRYGGKSERTKQARSETPMGFSLAFFKANP